jgi:hypothetical protein
MLIVINLIMYQNGSMVRKAMFTKIPSLVVWTRLNSNIIHI